MWPCVSKPAPSSQILSVIPSNSLANSICTLVARACLTVLWSASSDSTRRLGTGDEASALEAALREAQTTRAGGDQQPLTVNLTKGRAIHHQVDLQSRSVRDVEVSSSGRAPDEIQLHS